MSIPFEKVGSARRRGTEADRDNTAVILVGFLCGVLDVAPGHFHEHIRERMIERLNEVRRSQGLAPYSPPADRPSIDLTEARAHLGAALIQTTDSDDQIIIGHVRAAHSLLGGVL